MQRPKNSSFSEDDWDALSNMWHPVAYSTEVSRNRPFSATLLDVDLVLYRSENNEVVVASSVCPHRGANLRDGTMENGTLVCAYHAFHFGNDGKCNMIPAHPDMKIPGKMHLTTLPIAERFNIVWVCLQQEPINPLPKWEEVEDPAVETIRVDGPIWYTSAGRHVENFHDPAHFGWVHRETFGSPDNLEVPSFKVNREKFTITHNNVFKQNERVAFGDDSEEVSVGDRQFDYHFTFPFCSYLKVSCPTADFGWYSIYDVPQPITATECRVFLQYGREARTNNKESVLDILEFQAKLIQEDIGIIEKLVPLELSLDMTNQTLIPSDIWSVNYRRGLVELGLTTGINKEA